MENENKDKNIILTDEQLKEVAGGIIPPFNNIGQAKALECSRTTDVKACFEKNIVYGKMENAF